jgi:hypothetical protein
VEAMRERRMLDLVAVFTNETFTSNNQEFQIRRMGDVACLADC